MALRVVAPPSDTPVSLVEAKAHLRLEESADDAYVERLIKVATSHVELACGRALLQQTLELVCPSPCRPAVRLLGGPLQNAADVLSVAHLDASGTEVPISSSDVFVVLGGTSTPAELMPVSSWPSMSSRPDAFRVRYRVGWPTAAEVPAPLHQAVLLMVSQLYENRTPEVTGTIASTLALSLDALMAPYRFTSL